jgi:hypothetical protein
VNEILKGLSDGTFRAHWANEVLRTPLVTESIKLLLMSIAIEDMDEAGVFSVPREMLAVRVGRGKARISERLQTAVDAGLLVRVSEGKRGSTAVYAAAIKGSACSDLNQGPLTRTQSDEEGSAYPDPNDRTEQSLGPIHRTHSTEQNKVWVRSTGRYPDDEVRTAGPNAPEKGPHKRDANVEGGTGGSSSPEDSTEDGTLFGGEDAASRRTSEKPKRAKRATVPKIPLPPDFAPDAEMRAWARENCPLVDIDVQTKAFIVRFTPEPGEKPVTRPGWGRSWKAWMVRQQGWAQERLSNVRHLRPTGTDGYRPYRNPTDQSVYHEDL